MAKVTNSNNEKPKKIRPALTPEGRENQMISLAIDLVERQLQEGTASSQVITHYLKLGSTKEKLEMEKLREENKLLRAKTESLEAAKENAKLYEEVIKALRSYSGADDCDEEYYDEY